MRKGLQNPNSIQAVSELKLEIAREIGITDTQELINNRNNIHIQEINRKLVERSRNNIIGFK